MRSEYGCCQEYDEATNIVHLWFEAPPDDRQFLFDTAEDVRRHFANLTAYWRAHCRGRKAVYVVSLDTAEMGSIDPRLSAVFGEELAKWSATCALASFRYGGTVLHRTVVRATNIRLKSESNIYPTREAAMKAALAFVAEVR